MEEKVHPETEINTLTNCQSSQSQSNDSQCLRVEVFRVMEKQERESRKADPRSREFKLGGWCPLR